MIALLAALALSAVQQGPAPTVGDTIWVTRSVAVPPRYSVRAPDWSPTGVVELLGAPQIRRRGDSADVAFPLVAWVAGEQRIEVPGPLLLAPDGQVDSVASLTVTLSVASVLPAGVPESTLAPQPPAAIVPRTTRSPLPLLVAIAAALLLLIPVHFWWRRRGRAAPLAAPVADTALPVSQWAGAGEAHAVVTAAAVRLRARIAELSPEAHAGLDTAACLAVLRRTRTRWPLEELAEMLHALDHARFAPAPFADAMGLHERTDRLVGRLGQEAA